MVRIYERMMSSRYHVLCILVFAVGLLHVHGNTAEDDRMVEYLTGPDGYNKRCEKMFNQMNLASWEYNTNITDHNRKQLTDMRLVSSEFAKNESNIAAKYDQSAMSNSSLKRQLNMISDIGISGYDDKETLRKISDLRASMMKIYSSAKWCDASNDCKVLEPGLVDIMTNSGDYEKLTATWKGWRDVSGAKMKKQYEEFVTLNNKAIKAGGRYADMGDYYRSSYEQPTFEADVEKLFEDLSPLYDQLHAYVRRKLIKKYGEDKFPKSGHIPAQLFGNMWGQAWGNIYTLLEPYPGQGRKSLTEEMKRQNFNITHMYRSAEEFFTSIGMGPMPESFWRLSMLEKPTDRDVVCHASAWDMFNGTDLRIKQCTQVTRDQMVTVHHEMGHIQYYLEYNYQPVSFRNGANPGTACRIKQCTIVTEDQLNTVHHEMGHVQYFLEYINQPVLFRNGANPGFHEGVADIASLSFQTPEHLKEIGLLEKLPSGIEGDINFLFQMALDKVAFLPFGYLIDQWRWSVFRGKTTPDRYNTDWWKLRCKYQGISPPVTRSENDFDPGAKFHIPSDVPYIRYFVSFVAQFQWHKALCELIGKETPLHRCDIYRNRKAGARLQEMLQMGSSRPWGEAMRTITRGTSGETDKLDAQALLDYFKPLQEWLEAENRKAGDAATWDKTNCPAGSVVSSTSLAAAKTPSLVFTSVCVLITLKLNLY